MIGTSFIICSWFIVSVTKILIERNILFLTINSYLFMLMRQQDNMDSFSQNQPNDKGQELCLQERGETVDSVQSLMSNDLTPHGSAGSWCP